MTVEEREDMEKSVQAVKLLKTEKLRSMMIDLETDGCYDLVREEERTLKILRNVNEIINMAFNVVSKLPALLPIYRQMLESAVVTQPKARQFESVITSAFNKINKELNLPDDNPKQEYNPLLELQKRKNEQDYSIKKEQNELKREELNLKKAEALTNYMEKEKKNVL